MNKSTKVFLGVLATLAIATASGLHYYPQFKAKNAVREILNDPESARFEGLFSNRKTGAVCGYVNAKNRMGGYVGRQLFIVSSNGVVDFDTSSTEEKLQRMDSNQEFTNPIMARCYEK
nr:hypothetical protein [uncultured Undibacterium sp.]